MARARRSLAPAVLLAGLLLAAVPSVAAPPKLSAVTTALENGATVYVDPARKLGDAQRQQLAALARTDLRLVILTGAPPPATKRQGTADRILADAGIQGTVVVGFPGGANIATNDASPAEVAAAKGAAEGKKSVAAAIAAAGALPATPPVTTTSTTAAVTKAGDDGTPIWLWVLIAAGVLVLAGLAFVLLGSRRPRRSPLIAAARLGVQSRSSQLGRSLAESAVRVTERNDPRVSEHHAAAAETVAEVRAGLARLDGPPALRRANEQLDDAEWQLGVAIAHLDGTAEPPRPSEGRPARCFFNAEHGLASNEVELELPGVRTVTVGVCAACAVGLGRGEEPEVGVVAVGNRQLPWAAVPTWFGGWGWDADDLPLLRYQSRLVFVAVADRHTGDFGSPHEGAVAPIDDDELAPLEGTGSVGVSWDDDAPEPGDVRDRP
jgi:hypothetical protein